MLGNYWAAMQLMGSRVVLSAIELVIIITTTTTSHIQTSLLAKEPKRLMQE
jgi:hypothetical protein